MSDIASLGIKVESNLKTLNKDMEKTISLSEKVTDATNKINESFKSNVVEASKIIEAEKKKASAIDKMISSIKMQNIALVEGKSGLADYKLSILGASESQKKFAQDIIASMDSVRSARKSESEQVKSNLSSFKSALSEQAKVSQMAQDAEKSRLSSINSIIDSLSREEKSLSMTKQEQTKYNLALLGASDAEKKSAQDIQNRINAIKDSERAQKQATAQEKEASKVASKLAQEQAQAQKQIADAEIKRKDSINGIILKLRDEAATVGKSKAELTQYQLTLLGASEAEKKEAAALQNRIKAMQDANTAAKSHDSVLGSLISRLSALGAAYFGVQAIKNFASSLIDTAKIMDSYKYSLLAISENSTQAAETYEYLRKEADRLGLSLTTQEKAFTGFAAAAKQSGLRVEETRNIYSGLMEAMTAIHRSPEEASQALKAFQDMLSKGTIQAEELKKQLGNALPGAMAYMSDATGKSTAELMKMMEQGILPAKEGLIVLSDYLSNKFQLSAEGASNSMQGSLNKMENAWYELKAGIVEAMGNNTTGIIKDVTDTIKNMTDQLKDPEVQKSLLDLSSAIKIIGEVTLVTTQYITKMILAVKDFDPFDPAGIGRWAKTYAVGIAMVKDGLIDEKEFQKANAKERDVLITQSIKKQDEYTSSLIDSAKASETATDTYTKGWLRVSGAQVLSNKEMFAARGLTQEQGEELKKLTDKIKEQADVAGKTDLQIMEGNLRKLTSDEALIKSQLDLMKTTESKNQAVKDADKAAREAESERERAAEKAIADEKARQSRVDAIINKMKEQIATYKQATEVSAEYQLIQEKASPAEIKLAKDLANTIDALKAKTKAQEAYKKVMDKTAPDPIEMNRQKSIEAVNQAVKDGAVLNDTYAKTLEQINNHFDKLEMAESDKALKEMGSELDKLTKFDGSSFGNTIADGINNAMISMNKLNDTFDNNAKAQALIIKLQKEISTGKGSPEERKEKLEQIDKAESKMIENQISGYRQLFGTASQLFKENSREREVMHNIEMAFAAAEIAMNLEKTISAAYLAIAESGTLPPPASFAAIAAMTALMAGIVAAAGGSLSGGGSASAPSVSASSTQGTGTVMGNPSEKSQSANNALEFMKDIEAKQYNELRDINKGVVDLNNNITNLVTSIVRTGAGTGDMGIKTGVSGGISNIEQMAAKYSMPFVSMGAAFTDFYAGVYDKIPVLGQIMGGLSDMLDNAVSTVATTLLTGTKKTSITAQGLKVSTSTIGDLLEGAGLDVQKFADVLTTKKSGWLTGGGTKKYLNEVLQELTPDEESIKIMFTNVFKNVGETMVAISKELNMGDDKLKEIYSYVFDIGKIDLKGMDTDQINEAISSVINTASDQAVTALFGELIGKYVQVGEALLETAIRVVSERAVVLDILEMTGQGFKDSDIPAYSLEVTQSLISVAGGIKELQDASATYYDKFFSDSEKQIRLQGQLTETMAYMGQSMPSTRDGFRKIVESLDLTTDAGQRGYVTLLGLSESFASVFSKIEADNEKKLELELQIMNLTGKGAEAVAIQRQKEIDTLSEANKPLLERIYALQDEASALEIAKKAEEEANALLKKQADERIEVLRKEAAAKEAIENKRFDLELQILRLTGKESEALNLQRQKEINTLDDVNKPLQERIYALQDEATLLAESKKIEEERINELKRLEEEKTAILKAEADKAKEINDKKFSLEIEIMNLIGKGVEATALLRQKELSTLDEINKPLQERIYALQDEAAALEVSKKIEEEKTAAIKKEEEERLELLKKEAEKAKEISDKRFSLEIDILNLTGRTVEATLLLRQKELSSLDELNRPLQERVYALQDEAAAIAETNRIEEEQKQKTTSILNERIGLENELLNLQGNISEIRKRELSAINESNRSLQERIWNLKDEAELSNTINSAKQEIESTRQSLLKQLNDLTLDTNQLREIELNNLKAGSSLLNDKLDFYKGEKDLLVNQKEIIQEQRENLIAKQIAAEEEMKTLIESRKTADPLEGRLISEKIRAIIKDLSASRNSVYQYGVALASLGDSLSGYNSKIEAIEKAIASGDTASIVELQKQIWAIEDATKAEAELLEAQKKSEEDRINALKKAEEDRKALLEKNFSDAEDMLKKSVEKQIEFYQTLADEANKILEEAKGILDRSFAAEQESITKRHEDLIAGLTTRLNEAQSAASELEGVFNSLSDARKSMEGESAGLTYQAVQKQLADAITMARTGNISGAKGLVPNLGILTSQGADKYGSQEDYKRDFFKTYNALSELEKLTGTQLTEQQQIVKNLETQIEIANINNQLTLDSLQSQYDAVLGVDKSVISFAEAVIKYQKAQTEADGATALLKTQTSVLNTQLNVLLGINTGILSVKESIDNFLAAQLAMNPITETSIPGFASGGYHSGGLRIVGEVGPEMEYTPPANITSNNDLKAIMSNEEVVAELKAIRADNARVNFELVKNSGESKKTLREWQEIGILTRTA